KAIFEENGVAIPTTIDEWVTASEELTAKGITVLPIFGKEQLICNTFYDALVTRYIPEGLTGLQQGTTSIRDEGYLKAAQDLERLAAAGAFPAGVTTLNYEQATNLWYNGEAAMFLNGQWEISTTDEYLGD
ncbi:extracellular solute-binding protein, partial [Muribaculaceae bacterium Isolate-013 (NCI)]